MAHGNTSDMAFLLLLAGAIAAWAKPEILFSPDFPLVDKNVRTLVFMSGGVAFCIANMLSGVKWNKANGKMGGIGGLLAVANTVLLGVRTEQSLFYFPFAAALALGAVHIAFFPSNPPVAKGPKNKNNHGNTSDKVMLLLTVGALASIFYPDVFFQDLGPVKASFATDVAHRAEIEALLSFCGGLLFTVAMIFSGVKWNRINGRMAAIGSFVSAGIALYHGAGLFYYYHAAALLIGGVHVLFFPSNPTQGKSAQS